MIPVIEPMVRTLALILGTGFGAAVARGGRWGEGRRPVEVDTPWGRVRSGLFEVSIHTARVLVLLRHGEDHTIAPHRIEHRANLAALRSLGATHVVSFSSAGSLRPAARVGTFVVPTDFVDFMKTLTTCFDDEVRHTPMDAPFDARLSRTLLGAVREHAPCSLGGSYVGISGPRYPTRAEVRLYRQLGTVIGMTVVPEVILAGEMGLPYASCVLVTDNDVTVRHDAVVSAGAKNRAAFPDILEALARRFAAHDDRGRGAKPGLIRRLRAR